MKPIYRLVIFDLTPAEYFLGGFIIGCFVASLIAYITVSGG